MPSLLLIPAAVHAAGDTEALGLFGGDWRTGLLLVVVLLLLALLGRVHGREHSAAQRPTPRRSPVSYDELGRTVFEMAVNCDLDGYRGLFLVGGEARQIMGAGAGEYLNSRGLDVLEESLITIGAHIPDGSVYHGVSIAGTDRLAIQVKSPAAEVITVGIGTVAKVGAVVRLREPAYGD